jgi:hypothetical protein
VRTNKLFTNTQKRAWGLLSIDVGQSLRLQPSHLNSVAQVAGGDATDTPGECLQDPVLRGHDLALNDLLSPVWIAGAEHLCQGEVLVTHLLRTVPQVKPQVKHPCQFIQQFGDQVNEPLVTSGHGNRAMEIGVVSKKIRVTLPLLVDVGKVSVGEDFVQRVMGLTMYPKRGIGWTNPSWASR